MDCPFLKYVDRGGLSYDFFCKLTGQKVGDDSNKTKVEYTCRNSNFYNCPIYKKERG